MNEILKNIISLSKQENFETEITYQLVINAKDYLKKLPITKSELFITLSSLNLLNKAVKIKDFKNIIDYMLIKTKVSTLAIWVLKNYQMKFDTKIYVDNNIRCIYFKICELQFSFHDILINSPLLEFINSKDNIVQNWDGIRLQKVAAELFLYSVRKQKS